MISVKSLEDPDPVQRYQMRQRRLWRVVALVLLLVVIVLVVAYFKVYS